MSDLIRREDAISAIWDSVTRESATDKIKALPTAEYKRGRWIDKYETWCDDNTFECSVCGEYFDLIEGTPEDNGMRYCPWCGAKMERSE